MNKKIFFLLIGLLVFSGCQKNLNNIKVNQFSGAGITCLEDIKVCPDGSIVKRSGENCEFTACPEATAEKLVEPIAEFKSRITKKPFGIYITPQTSPVQPERFSGYHTGVDVEYADVKGDVPVFAIALGKVIYANWVSGYGNIMIVKSNIDGKDYQVLYGHLSSQGLATLNKEVKPGDQIGFLGLGGSDDTDGERKHLHFSIYAGEDINLRGYVQTEEKLNKWIDPLLFY